ncbi:MAG: thioredoxin family protein [Patescibacteria group bacterium]
MVLLHTPAAALGERIHQFSLPGTDGKIYSPASFTAAPAVVIVFTCNHCPYAQYAKPKLIELNRLFAPQGVQFVAINPNDADAYPEDSFESMKQPEYNLPFPYLRDESQAVAQEYGAVCTPDIFVYDGRRELAYRGQVDNGRPGHESTTDDLKQALQLVLDGQKITAPQQPSAGCSIKWKETA